MIKKVTCYLLAIISVFTVLNNYKPVYAVTNDSIKPLALDVTLITNKVTTKVVEINNVKLTVNIRYDYYKDANGTKWIDKIHYVSSSVLSTKAGYSASSYSQSDWYETVNSTIYRGEVNVSGTYYWGELGNISVPKDISGKVSFYPGE